MHREFSTIKELLLYARQASADPTLQKGVCLLGRVSAAIAEWVARETGLDVTEYHFSLEHAAIRHILSRHGKTDKEELWGQAAIEEADIIKIADYLEWPTPIAPGQPRRKDIKLIEFVIINSEWQITLVLEVRTGRKILTPVTMYKRKGQPQ